MLPAEFREWRQKLGLTQAQAGARFGVSRITIQNWEGGDAPIPAMAESHWLRLRRQRSDYGPVELHYMQHLVLTGAGIGDQVARHEPRTSVEEAFRRIDQVKQINSTDFYITDGRGEVVFTSNEIEAGPIRPRRFNAEPMIEPRPLPPAEAKLPRQQPSTSKPSPEEIERRRRLIKGIQDEVKKLPVLDPNFTDKDLYDEFGLPK